MHITMSDIRKRMNYNNDHYISSSIFNINEMTLLSVDCPVDLTGIFLTILRSKKGHVTISQYLKSLNLQYQDTTNTLLDFNRFIMDEVLIDNTFLDILSLRFLLIFSDNTFTNSCLFMILNF